MEGGGGVPSSASSAEETLSLDLFVPRTPREVRAWWTEFPDDYRAVDPQEQPFRIVTVQREANERHLQTHWRRPDGALQEVREVLTLVDETRWRFVVANPLFEIVDDFHAVAVEGGTRLEIRSVLCPRNEAARAQLPAQKERMTLLWKRCPELCARDAAPSVEER